MFYAGIPLKGNFHIFLVKDTNDNIEITKWMFG